MECLQNLVTVNYTFLRIQANKIKRNDSHSLQNNEHRRRLFIHLKNTLQLIKCHQNESFNGGS